MMRTDSVRIVIFDEQGRFVLVVESDDPNAKLPGGKFHEGETPLELMPLVDMIGRISVEVGQY